MVTGSVRSYISSVLRPVDKAILLKVLNPTGDGEVREHTASECRERWIKLGRHCRAHEALPCLKALLWSSEAALCF